MKLSQFFNWNLTTVSYSSFESAIIIIILKVRFHLYLGQPLSADSNSSSCIIMCNFSIKSSAWFKFFPQYLIPCLPWTPALYPPLQMCNLLHPVIIILSFLMVKLVPSIWPSHFIDMVCSFLLNSFVKPSLKVV